MGMLVNKLVASQMAQCPRMERISTCAFDVATFLDLQGPRLQDIIQSGVGLTFLDVFGPNEALLTDPWVEKEAEALKVSPAILALKWAEHQGARSVMPHL